MFYEVKVTFKVEDENTGKMKNVTAVYLVEDDIPEGAITQTRTYLKDSTNEWEITSVKQTKIEAVLQLEPAGVRV
jgi:hypothetical protein